MRGKDDEPMKFSAVAAALRCAARRLCCHSDCGRRQHCTTKIFLVALISLSSLSIKAPAQEALRMSLASAEAAEARRKAASTIGFYNLELGRTFWGFTAGLGIDYDSNVTLTRDHEEDDFIFRPEVDVKFLMPVSDKNTLNVSAGVGYSAYVMHSNLRRFYVTPDSEVSFDLYAGDVWINLHDRISVTENSYQDPTVAGNGGYSQLQNAAGISATWDLNKVVLKCEYDHVNYAALSGASSTDGQADGSSELISASAGCFLGAGLQVGVELGGGLLHYSTTTTNNFFSDATQWNAGAFCEAQPGEYFRLRASAGYTTYIPDSKGTNGAQTFRGVYAELDLIHRLNQYVEYTLSGGRSVNFAFFGGTVDLYFARWNANWKIFRKTSVSTSFDFEHGTQLGIGAETFDRYGPGISFGRMITEKLSGDISGQFYWRDSNLANRDYTAFIISSNFRYKF
jgi:hypothetical protein